MNDKYEVLRTIHKTFYSTVQLAQHKQTGLLYALKSITVPEVGDDEFEQVVTSVEQIDPNEYSQSDSDHSGESSEDIKTDTDTDSDVNEEPQGITICVDDTTNRRELTDVKAENADQLRQMYEGARNYNLQKKQETMRLIQQEIMVTQHLMNHSKIVADHPGRPFIVNMEEMIEDVETGAIVLALEYVNGGDLFDMVTEGPLSHDRVKKYFKQACLGVDFLHSCGIAHRDIKCENIYYDKDKDRCKVGDYGHGGVMISKKSNKKKKFSDLSGTLHYLSPEQIRAMEFQGEYDGERVDVWALGCVLYIMLTGISPFESDLDEEDDFEPTRQRIKNLEVNYRYKPFRENPCLVQLFSEGIFVQEDKRYTILQLLEHEWLRGVQV